MSADGPTNEELTEAVHGALDVIDRLRMAAGEDLAMPTETLIGEVERMFGVQQRAYHVARHHPQDPARTLAWWICTDDGPMPEEVAS